jgi:hypothetical protein
MQRFRLGDDLGKSYDPNRMEAIPYQSLVWGGVEIAVTRRRRPGCVLVAIAATSRRLKF